jgi:hypothetical protein
MFVEPDPRYRDPYEVDDDTETAGEVVLLEDGDGALLAHTPAPAVLGGRLYFVDGVRRTDFRAHAFMADGSVVRGLGGSYAAGAVCCTPAGRPVFDRMEMHRLLLWTHGYGETLPAVGGWEWTVESLAIEDPERLLPALQARMRKAEADLADELVGDGALVLRDGPLNRFYGIDVAVAGLVKSHYEPYLPPDIHHRVPAVLAEPGQRTSLFRLRDEVWGCYLRLPTTGRASPWAGIVRIDVPAAGGLEAAVGVADRVCALIPRYSGVPHVDPRAPANLQPIGALETRLRHCLGDPAGARRAASDAAALHDRSRHATAPPPLPVATETFRKEHSERN